MAASPRFINPVCGRTMAALELTYCRQSRATEASIDGKETIATTILDYMDVEKALHRLDVFDPVRCSSF